MGPTQEMSFDEPGSGNEDVPQDASPSTGPCICTANGGGNGGCNGDSNTVRDLIDNKASRDKEVNLTTRSAR